MEHQKVIGNKIKNKIKNKIREIDLEYKSCYKDYCPTQQEILIQQYLLDLFTIKDEKSSTNGRIGLFFIDNSDSSFYTYSFSIKKILPKRKETTPLYYIFSRLSKLEDMNFFICPNIFQLSNKSFSLIEGNIFASNVIYIDIDDFSNTDLSKPIYNCTEDEIDDFLYRNYSILNEIKPNFYLMSGRGLHLYFLIKNTKNLYSQKYYNKDKRTQKEIITKLISILGGDKKCTNLNRVMRFPFSINQKYNIPTRMYYKGEHRYSYEYLLTTINKYMPKTESESETPIITQSQNKESIKNKKPYKVKSNNTKESVHSSCTDKKNMGIRTLMLDRANDLESFFYHHLHDLQGRRSNFFLIYKNTISKLYPPELVERKMIYLNSKLDCPLPENEIRNILEYKKRYTFSGGKIADLLEFTQEEINSFHASYTIEQLQNRQRLNILRGNNKVKEMRTKRKQEKIDYIFRVLETHQESTNKEIADILHMSIRNVTNYKKLYKETHK